MHCLKIKAIMLSTVKGCVRVCVCVTGKLYFHIISAVSNE